jgi:hypothetical protein
MSASRTTDRLLRLYPRAWRERYGEELADVIVATSGDHVPWRVRLDVVRSGARERLRSSGLSGDGAPRERVRGGALLVLCAWALFVLAGGAVQKISEHWQDTVAPADRALPQAAFAVLVGAAVCGGLLVLAGIAATLPSLSTLRRAPMRRVVLPAAALTAVALAATVALVVWAHGLTPAQRDGHDAGYAAAFLAWAVLCAACLLAWTGAAVSIARRVELRAPVLRLEARLAVGVTVAMGVMTAATVVWWAALGDHGGALVAAAVMLVATGLGAAGSRRAVQALPAIGPAA